MKDNSGKSVIDLMSALKLREPDCDYPGECAPSGSKNESCEPTCSD